MNTLKKALEARATRRETGACIMGGSAKNALLNAVERARTCLETEDAAREKLLAITREIARLSRQVVFRLHDGDVEDAKKILDQLAPLVEELLEFKTSNPRLYYGGSVTSALTEYVEATALYHYMKGLGIPSFEELKVEPVHYLLGLADFTGELRRLLLRHLSNGEYTEAERELRCMEDVYRALVSIAVPEALVPGLRRKVDVLRALIESSIRDLHYSQSSSKLEQAIRELLCELRGEDV